MYFGITMLHGWCNYTLRYVLRTRLRARTPAVAESRRGNDRARRMAPRSARHKAIPARAMAGRPSNARAAGSRGGGAGRPVLDYPCRGPLRL